MNKDEPLISIVMPAYNCENYIKKTINSVINQVYQNWELIIVDDCSTDNTREIIEKFPKINSKIKLIFQSRNQGAAVSRNKGIKESSGKYIAFLDSDDIWNSNKLEFQINYMEKTGNSFTCTEYGKIDDNGKDLHEIIKVKDRTDYIGLLKSCPGNSTVVYNADILGKNYIPNIKKRNDYVMWLQIIKKTDGLIGIKKNLSSHRVRAGSISSDKISLVKYHWKVYRKIERLSILYSSYLIIYWMIKGVFHKLKKN